MTAKNGKTVADQKSETEEGEATDFSKISETRISILQERAETQLEEQNRRIELLLNQLNRLETIRYGVLTLLLLVGLYSGAEITDSPDAEVITSLVWFLVVGFSIAFNTIFSKYLGRLSASYPFVSGQDSSIESIVDKLTEASSNHVGEEAKLLDDKAEEIVEKRRRVRQLESELRFSHLVLAIVLLSMIIFGLPSFTLLNFFGPIIAI